MRRLDGMDVPRETERRLETYADLLKRWNARINLVAPSTLDDVWTRHFADSAALLEFAPKPCSWVDLGAGGGFPGMVCAIVGGPDIGMTLIEADQRKCAFLRTVARETRTRVNVLPERIENARLEADVLSARALAPLVNLLEHAERFLTPGGIALFQKGRRHEDELTKALERFRFTCEKHPSHTEEGAVILKIGDIRRV